MIKFGLVGVIAMAIDVGVLVLLRECFRVDVLISAAVSFSASVIINYILSMMFVFKGKDEGRVREFVLFVSLSAGGLLINQLIMWAGLALVPFHYLWVKIFATAFVTVYNFVTRKIFLEKKAPKSDE